MELSWELEPSVLPQSFSHGVARRRHAAVRAKEVNVEGGVIAGALLYFPTSAKIGFSMLQLLRAIPFFLKRD